MTAVYPTWLDSDEAASSITPVKRMLVVSLAVHLLFLALLAGIRFTPKIERLQATQVTLVSLSPAQPEATLPPPVEAAPPPSPQTATPRSRASAPIAAKVP